MLYRHPSPHDSFFGNIMEIKSVAQSFFLAHLPAAIKQAIDWSTLHLAESARRHPGKKTTYTDITYQCLLAAEKKPIFLHCEQQRNAEARLAERTMRYNLGLISQYRKQGNKKLPMIVNFVVYNNPKAGPQPYPTHAWDYFEVPWIAKLISNSYFYLVNLKEIPDETLANHGPCSVMELLLKRADGRNFIPWLVEHNHLIQGIVLDDIFSLSIGYALAVGKEKADHLIETFEALFPQQKQNVMSAARQLETRGLKQGLERGIQQGLERGIQQGLERGIQRGLERGRKEEKIAIAKNMLLKLHLDLSTVQQATELTKEELESLLQK